MIQTERSYFYDIEIIHSLFVVTFISFETNRVKIFTHHQARELAHFLNNDVKLLVGYNNKGYDDIMLRYGLTCLFTPSRMKAESDKLINCMKREEQYDTSMLPRLNCYTVDVMGYLFSSLTRRPLKLVAANLGFINVMDSPVDFNKKTHTDSEIKKLILYNINDVLAIKFIYFKTYKKFDLKIKLTEATRLDVMASSDTKFAKRQIANFFTKTQGMDLETEINLAHPDEPDVIQMKDILNPKVAFRTKPFQDFLSKLRKENSISIKDKRRTKWTKFAVTPELTLQFGLGGERLPLN